MALTSWTVPVCLVLNAYLLGVMVLFATVSYPQLGESLTGYSGFTGRIAVPVVTFEFLAFFATLALYAVKPEPMWAVHAIVALGVGYFVITFGWHLPAHRALAAGDRSPTDMARLLASQWARTALQVIRVGLLMNLSRLASVR